MASLYDIKDTIIHFFTGIKDRFAQWIISLHLDTQKIMSLGLVFVIGLALAVFIKRFFKETILLLIGLFVVIFLLHYFSFITINWLAIRSSIHVQPTDTIESVFTMISALVRAHFLYVVSFGLGFFIGSRIG